MYHLMHLISYMSPSVRPSWPAARQLPDNVVALVSEMLADKECLEYIASGRTEQVPSPAPAPPPRSLV